MCVRDNYTCYRRAISIGLVASTKLCGRRVLQRCRRRFLLIRRDMFLRTYFNFFFIRFFRGDPSSSCRHGVPDRSGLSDEIRNVRRVRRRSRPSRSKFLHLSRPGLRATPTRTWTRPSEDAFSRFRRRRTRLFIRCTLVFERFYFMSRSRFESPPPSVSYDNVILFSRSRPYDFFFLTNRVSTNNITTI